ncbi:MAG TPA: phage portal protein [Pseudonocardia sp.]
MAEASDLTPIEWLARLGRKLEERRARIDYWRRYYDGDQDLPAGPSQHAQAYRRFQRLARTNLCRLAVDSMVPRLQVTGFRDGSKSPEQDNPVWSLWQAAKLDARQFSIWRKALSRSTSYVIVGVDPRNTEMPRVTIEGPENVIVERDSADPQRRLAALRMWHDPVLRRWMATLYLPGVRHHWQSVKSQQSGLVTDDSRMDRLSFRPDSWEQRAEPGRSLRDVPVVEFMNGDPGEDPEAEFAVGIDCQNRLNLTLLNRLTAERYGAFRQSVMTNYEPVVDEVTGLVIPPYNPGADQIITIPPPEAGQPPTELKQLQQTDTLGILRSVEADMRAFAAVTTTPVYYLPGDLINIGADSIMALDAGHVAKIRQLHGYWGEDMEEVLSLMADVAGISRDLESSEVVWARPENFNPAAVADYAGKLKAAGVPLPMIAEEIGWSPQRVSQLRTEMASAAFIQSLSAPRPAPAGSSPPAPRPPAAV